MKKLSKSDRAHLNYMWLSDAYDALKRAHDARAKQIKSDGLTAENSSTIVEIHGPTLSRLLEACERAMSLDTDPFGVCFLESGKASHYSIKKKIAVVAKVKARAYKLSCNDSSFPAEHVKQAIDDVARDLRLSGTDGGTVQKWCEEYWAFVPNPE